MNKCIEWQGSRNAKGYGRIGQKIANRIFWEHNHGPIPKGLCILHKCDNPSCVNESHIYLGTKKQNADDMFERGRVTRKHESNGRHRLTKCQVDEIRKTFVRKYGAIAELARKYDVSHGAMSWIVNKRSWL